MKENETIAEMITRFTDITNSLIALGKEYTQVEKVKKVLLALIFDWEKKITAKEEANDLSTITLESLVRNLIAYKAQIEDKKKDEQQHQSKKKVLAFHASSNTEDSDDEEEEIVMILRKNYKVLETK